MEYEGHIILPEEEEETFKKNWNEMVTNGTRPFTEAESQEKIFNNSEAEYINISSLETGKEKSNDIDNDLRLLSTIWSELSKECRDFLEKVFAGSKATQELNVLLEKIINM